MTAGEFRRLLALTLVLSSFQAASARSVSEGRQWVSGRVLLLEATNSGNESASHGAEVRARVRLIRLENEHQRLRRQLEGSNLLPVLETEADGDGLFLLTTSDAGPWRLEVGAPGRIPREIVLPPLPQELDLPPVELATIQQERIQILDPDGAPVPSAWWRLTDELSSFEQSEQLENGWRRAWRSGWTDRDGLLDLGRAQGETLWLEVLSANGRDLISIGPAVGGGGAEHQPRSGARELQLRVVFESNPVAGALIQVDGRPVALTDAVGVASVVVGSMSVVAASAMEGTARFEIPLRESQPMDSPSPRDPTLLELQALPADVRVTAQQNAAPLAGARALVGGTLHSADNDGVIRWPDRGEDVIWVGAASYRGRWLERSTWSGDRTPSPIALELTSTIEGVVLRDERPVAGVELVATARADGWKSWARSRQDGTFRLTGLRPATPYTLNAQWKGAGLDTVFASPAALSRGKDLVIELPRLVTAVGQVVEAEEEGEGRALAGVEVALASSRRLAPRGVVETDEQGRFDLEGVASQNGWVALRLSKPGYVPATAQLEHVGSSDVLDFGSLRLERGVELELWITDDQGRAIEGATASVAATHAAVRRRRGFGRSTTGAFAPVAAASDRTGTLILDSLSRHRRHTVRVSAAGYVTTQADDLEVPQGRPLEIQLQQAALVAGRVIDQDGEPIGNAHVAVASANPVRSLADDLFTRTDTAGRFELTGLPPGAFKVWTRAYGKPEPDPIELRLEQGDERRDLVFRIPEGALVEGVVVDASGAGVEDVAVVSAGVLERTDARGRFRLDGVRLGRQEISAKPRRGSATTEDIEVRAGGAWVELVLETGFEVAGRVLGGQPDDRFTVLMTGDLRDGNVFAPAEVAGSHFSFPRVAPGRYRIRADDERGTVIEPLEIEVTDRPLRDLELVLRDSAVVSGRVRVGGESWEASATERGSERDGPRLGRAISVVATSADGKSLATVVEDDGQYRIAGLTVGAWTLSGGIGSVSAVERYPLEIVEGEWKVDLDLDLSFDERSKLIARLTVDGAPLARGWLSLASPGGQTAAMATSNYLGLAEVDGVAPGPYDLMIATDGTVLSYLGRVRVEGETEVDFRLTRAVVAGTVRDGSGQPLAGARLIVVAPNEAPAARLRRGVTRTSAGGFFQIEALVEGPFWVRAVLDGYEPAEQLVTPTAPGQVQEIMLTMLRR